ncbi:MAG: hypothetical protein ACRD8O_02825 [Bryobacteraceae bacterium]
MDEQTMHFFEQMFDSLKREMGERFDKVETRLDRMGVRLDRQGALIQAGMKSWARFVDWSENIDRLLAERDRRLDALEERLRKLEGGGQLH